MPLSKIANNAIETGSQYTGFKNRIINGAMMIDQRNAGASFTSNGLLYCIDRWILQAVGATNTAQQVTGYTGNNKALKVTGNTGNTFTGVIQRIESNNIYDCASQTVTFSFILSGSASGSASIRFLYPTATDNYTATTEPVAGTTVNFTTTPTLYTVTRTLDSNANKGVEVVFDFGSVGSGVTRTIEFVQLEKGSTATSFDYRPYGTELALCQRYFEISSGDGSVGYYSAGGASNGYAEGRVVFITQKRTTPTISIGYATLGDGNVNWDATGSNNATIASSVGTTSATRFNVSKSSGLAYIPYQIVLKWSASAEL